jgi:hypothetical protein
LCVTVCDDLKYQNLNRIMLRSAFGRNIYQAAITTVKIKYSRRRESSIALIWRAPHSVVILFPGWNIADSPVVKIKNESEGMILSSHVQQSASASCRERNT